MPVLTYGTIALTVIVSFAAFYNSNLFEKYSFSVSAILQDREYHRVITSMFLHINWVHLLFNMFALYSFGAPIESRFGVKIMLVIILYSAVAGSLLALAVNRKKPGYKAVGASGAVCGVIFASIFLLPGGSVIVFPVPVPVPAWLYGVLFMVISLYGIGRGGSNIGHEAHLGGALAGIAWAVLYEPSIIEKNAALLAGLTLPVVILLLYFIVYKKTPGDESHP